jgi:predicted glycoside hydrolase/deacetylase ChbG (UPF0249 family)
MQMPSSRAVVLCADDFALAEGVSEAILRLVAAGRLSAISCMAISPLWASLAGGLRDIQSRCDVGLHLTLTEHAPTGRMPKLAPGGRLPGLGRLTAIAFAGGLDRTEVRAEVLRQYDAFVSAHHRPPDFIDGHQHVHLLPGIRDSVLELVASHPPDRRPYLRLCWEAPARVLARRIAVDKAMLIAWLSLPLRRAAARLGLAANDSFRGVHEFDPRADYATLFPRFLTGGGRRPLVMCHPGFPDDRLRVVDRVTDQRRDEYDYFASERFIADLEAADCRLARFDELAAGSGGPGFSAVGRESPSPSARASRT